MPKKLNAIEFCEKYYNEHGACLKLKELSKSDELFINESRKSIRDTLIKVIKYRKPESLTELIKILKSVKKFGKGLSIERFITIYGIEEGKKRWDSYCKKQAESNTFEYKKRNGLIETKEQFDEYNKSRAVTLKNQIKKYGDVEGKKRWDSYCKRQAYTNSKEYFGQEKYEFVNF